MKKEKKIDFVAILVYLVMLLLLIIIILPPVLRLLIPTDSIIETSKEKVELLICRREMEFDLDNVMIKATTNYKNNEFVKLTLLYTKELKDETVTTVTNSFDNLTEIKSFKELTGIEVKEREDEIHLEISKNVMEANLENEFLQNYYQTLGRQNSFYTEHGYTCQVLEN